MKISCPVCYDDNANCWWSSDSNGSTYTWITWHHSCAHCGYSVNKVEQFMYNAEDVEKCTIVGHNPASPNGHGERTVNHALNLGINNKSNDRQTESLLTEIEKLKSQLNELQLFDQRSITHGGVFISHAHEDKDIVGLIIQKFTSDGINYWVDEKDLLVGQVMDKAISEGIQKSWLFLIILTESSVSSKWVERELDEASHEEVSGGKIIMPVVAKGLKAANLPPRLRRKYCVDLSTDFVGGYEKLKASIQSYMKSRRAA